MVTFGYLEADEILYRLSSGKTGPRNLRALLDFMKWPGEKSGLTMEESREQLVEHAGYMKSQRKDLKNFDAEEVVALSILESKLPNKTKEEVFGHVSSEEHLKPPVAKFLEEDGFTPFEEVKIGKSRADLVGLKRGLGGLTNHVLAVEIKTKPNEMKRFLDQVTDYGIAADKTFLAATPFAIIQYLHKYGRSWYSNMILEDKLDKVGCGLLIVDMSLPEDQCHIEIESANESTEKGRKNELVNLLKTLRPFR